MCLAFFQFVTTFILIGFIFALIWSVLIIKKAWQSKSVSSTEQGEQKSSFRNILKSATRDKPRDDAKINVDGFDPKEARKQWGVSP